MTSTSPATPPVRPAPNAPFHPHADMATYRDLLLFEERLKMNAEMLRRRRTRYMVFLWSFVLATLFMSHHLLITPPQTLQYLRTYQGLLAMVLITLILFFASGMYDEKIRYAHAYLAHSNKVLRPLNMHLNTRRPPLFSSLLRLIPFVGSSRRPSPASSSGSGVSTSISGVALPIPAPPTSTLKPTIRRANTSTLLPTIPPSSNPRGELIFSSRVDRGFREGYERYRAAFERRREEKERAELWGRRRRRWGWLVWWWRHSIPTGSALGLEREGEHAHAHAKRSSVSLTPTQTPPGSRRGTPPPSMGSAAGQEMGRRMRDRERERERSGSPSGLCREYDRDRVSAKPTGDGTARVGSGNGSGTATPESARSTPGVGPTGSASGSRERAESYSFVWTGHKDAGPLRRAP